MDNTPKPKKTKGMHAIGFYLLIVGFICIILAGVLGLRIFDRVGGRPHPVPRETNISLIQEWMTVPYLSRTYGVPKEVLFEKLNLDPQKYSKSSLSQISKGQNIELSLLIDSLKNMITEFQSQHQKPPPPNE